METWEGRDSEGIHLPGLEQEVATILVKGCFESGAKEETISPNTNGKRKDDGV